MFKISIQFLISRKMQIFLFIRYICHTVRIESWSAHDSYVCRTDNNGLGLLSSTSLLPLSSGIKHKTAHIAYNKLCKESPGPLAEAKANSNRMHIPGCAYRPGPSQVFWMVILVCFLLRTVLVLARYNRNWTSHLYSRGHYTLVWRVTSRA